MTELRSAETQADARALRDIDALTQSRRHAEAMAAARKLLARAPAQRGALYLTALNLRLLGRADEALETLSVLERAHPNYSLLYEERGHCLVALGDPARALPLFERAVALNPALAASWTMLERLHIAAGRPQDASLAAQHLAKLRELPPAIVEAGRRFCDDERAAAEALLTDFVAREGRHVEALRLLGRIAQQRGALERAESLLSEAAQAAPTYVAARLDYLRVLIERQKYPSALQEVDWLLLAAPADAEARFLRATILASLGRHDEAAPIFEELLARTPKRNHLRIVLGHSLKALGRAEEAVRAYREASQGEADVGDAYWSLANLKTYRFDDDEIARMRRLEAQSAPPAPDRAQLRFALAKALEDRGDYGQSWALYERANELARSQRRYRPEAVEDEAGRLIDACGEDFFAAHAGAGVLACDPIFIVGLPRSGSTLLEQILASHRDVDGTQELYDIPRLAAELKGPQSPWGGGRYPEPPPDLDPLLFARLGRRYLDDTRAYRRGRPRFVDKMPNNFWHIGLIHLMLPNARIIDVRRAPMACCVSNLKQFYARGQDFSYGIETIARYYRTYLELMRHWDRVLPQRVLRVAYEDLVEDLETNARRILAHCELAFDPACLEFHRSRRAVNTPSSEQVRQPIFRAGLSQWRRFEPWLDPLREALGDAIWRHGE